MSFTTNFQLIKQAKKLNIHLNGVYMKNELPKFIYAGGYIINLMSSTDGNGSHWVCCWIQPSGIAYFDSFGLGPPIVVLNWFKTITDNVIINKTHIQNVNSGYCGFYCLAFLKYMTKLEKSKIPLKTKFQNFVDIWHDENQIKNLKFLKEIIRVMRSSNSK